ncbi:MAG: TonB-dependent receptor [Candidatus Marinimicrobia bacterium]|nr:TonB-dependent receptor [Candidatus Neomarinimicrobiota bacterium]
MTRLINIILTLLSLSSLLLGQVGSVSGRVINSSTDEPLVGVNIVIKGTYYGAASGLDGYYSIVNIAPGSYDIETSIIGYKIILRTGIVVTAGERTSLDFDMEETVLALGEEIVVLGKKPLFDVDATASQVIIRSDDLTDKVVSSVEDILSEQIGITTQDNEIHIRGGRIDESMFIVDGFSVKDPLSGYSGNLFVNAEAIEELEIITGGYDAEYGQAMSGIVNIKLKEGRDNFEGAFKYASDNFGLGKDIITHYNTDRLELNFGGPALLLEKLPNSLGLDLPGKFSFFMNGYGKVYNSNLPNASKLYPHRNWKPPAGMTEETADKLIRKLAPRENNDWHVMYKLTWDVDAMKKLSTSYDVSMNINQGYFMPRAFSSTYYPYRYQEILDYYNTITRESRLASMNWVHTINTRTFYELTVGRFITMEHSAVQDLHWSEYRERLDLEPIEYVLKDEEGNIRIDYGDEFYDTGFAPEWYDIYSDNWRYDFDRTYHTKKRHKIKTGWEHSATAMQVLDIEEPWTGTTGFGANYDKYKVKTHFGALYVQDRIIFEGMTLNLGMRYDYWMPGRYVEDAIYNTDKVLISEIIDWKEMRKKFDEETFELLGYRAKGRISPRFGISHPVTNNDVLYFYYGHFSQLPTFQYVYAKLNTSSQSAYQVIGNPNLNPKTTVQYELGIKHRFSEDQVLELKAYWKDMFDYETSQTIVPSNPKFAHLRFNMYFNADYARSRGVEFILKSRVFRNWYADLNFNYSIVTGKSSSPKDNLYVQAGEIREKPLGENFMSWDRPIQLFSNISYNHPSNWGLSIRLDYRTGRRYTASIPGSKEFPDGFRENGGVVYYTGTTDDDRPYYAISEIPEKTIDIKIFKSFTVNSLRFKTFIEIENLLDSRIPRRINSYTGYGYDPGEIYSYSMLESPDPNYDPSRVRPPRATTMGVQILF